MPRKTKQPAVSILHSSVATRHDLVYQIQSFLLLEHQVACGNLHHVTTDVGILSQPPEARASVAQAALDKYADTALRLVKVLTALIDHEKTFLAFPAGTNPAGMEPEESDPTPLEWDLLLRLSQQIAMHAPAPAQGTVETPEL